MIIRDGKVFRTLNTPIFVGDKHIKAIYCGNKLIYPEDSKLEDFKYELVIRVRARRQDHINYIGSTWDSWMISYPTKNLAYTDIRCDFTVHIKTAYPIALVHEAYAKCNISDVPGYSGEFWQQTESVTGSGFFDLKKIYLPANVPTSSFDSNYSSLAGDLIKGRSTMLIIVEGDWRREIVNKSWIRQMKEQYGFSTPAFYSGNRTMQSGIMGGGYAYLDPYSIESIEEGYSLTAEKREDTRWRTLLDNYTQNAKIEGDVEFADMQSTALPSGNLTTTYGETYHNFFKDDSNKKYPPFYPGRNVPEFSQLLGYRTFVNSENNISIGSNPFEDFFVDGSSYATTHTDSYANATLSLTSSVDIVKNDSPDFSSLEEYADYLSHGHSEDEVLP